ncbi:hypothetical protein KIW84_023884 [Lathyrus oleraceus]|uniref:O-GlcNAc transferase C-terminal domain-containing protein n=1 Tax=Pisum sativum TaxID=3888 RepID=A0A9D4YF05_PEA|nr:hypothetical protein KIW84_023884 [Pisum sativum]
MHNSKNMVVFCFALSPNDDTEWRRHVQVEAGHFLEVPVMTVDTLRLERQDAPMNVDVGFNMDFASFSKYAAGITFNRADFSLTHMLADTGEANVGGWK